MNRLIQGDVGSGKTAVAMAAALIAIKNGYQAVVMAPTEVLAGQNYESFKISFNDVFSMKPEQLQLGFLKVLKGSKIHKNAGKYGIAYSDKPPYEVLYTKWLSYDEILKLKQIDLTQ